VFAFFNTHFADPLQRAESFFWVAAQLALGVVGTALWLRLKSRLGTRAEGPLQRVADQPQRAEALSTGGRLIYSLAIPYLAILFGSISARDTGLVGLDAFPYSSADWLHALGWAGAWAALALVIYAWGGVYPGATPGNALLDEVRWAFYRGAAIGWVGQLFPGVLLGLSLAAVEWAAIHGLRTALGESTPPWLGWAARAWLSTFVFLFTRNVWLTLAVGTLVPLALSRWRLRYG